MSEVQQPNEQNNCCNSKCKDRFCFIFVLAYFSTILLLLIIFIIFTVEAIQQNEDQYQIQVMGELLIIISIIIWLALAFYIYQLKSFYYNSQNSKFLQNSYEVENQNTTFCLRQEQMRFLPIHYFFFIFGIALALLIVKLRPTSKKFCKDSYDCSNCPDENTPNDCYYNVEYDPEYEGPLLTGLSDFSIFIASLIFLILPPVLVSYTSQLNPNQHPKSYKPHYIKRTKTSAKICLFLFLVYSILKIILYGVIMENYQNPNSVLLIVSNIYFHSIMILVIFRSFYLVGESKQDYYGNFYNYMTLISEIVQQDKMNKVLNILSALSLPLAIAGAVIYESEDDQSDIINVDSLIYFDCLGVQIFAVLMLILVYLIGPYCVCATVEEEKPEKEKEKPLPIKKKKIIKKPYIYVTKLNPAIKTCAICLQSMQCITLKGLVRMRCHKTHIFHKECIDEWLKNHNKCPICNSDVKRS